MDEHQLRCFLAIAEFGSVSRAAARLGAAQPTLSQVLLRLEDELRVKLFERTSRGVSPTAAGAAFQDHARAILHEMQRAREEMRRHDPTAQESVVVGLPQSTSSLLGARLAVAAAEQLGGITLRLDDATSVHIREWLEEGRIELGILHNTEALRQLSVRRLAIEELFLIGPPGRFGPDIPRNEIALPAAEARPFILPGPRHHLRQFIDGEAQAQGITLKVDVELDTLVHIKALVSSGQGCTILPHAAVQEDLASGRLTAARISRPLLRRPVYLVRHPRRVVTRASQQVEELIVSILKGMVADGSWLAQWVGP